MVQQGRIKWTDVLWACLGFGFEAGAEAVYQSSRCIDQVRMIMLLICFGLGNGLAGFVQSNAVELIDDLALASTTNAAGLAAGHTLVDDLAAGLSTVGLLIYRDDSFLGNASSVYVQQLVFYVGVHVGGILILQAFLTWARSNARFAPMVGRCMPLIGMGMSAMGHAGCIVGVVKNVDTLSTVGATHCITCILCRPLAAKALLDVPVWWLLLLMLGQVSYFLLRASVDLQITFTEACRPGSVVHWRVCLCYILVIWLEWSRRSDFIKRLQLCRARPRVRT